MKKNSAPQLFEILADMVGQRLDKALSLLAEVGTRSRAENLIDQGSVTINGVIQKSSYKVRLTDKIEIAFPAPEPSQIQPLNLKLDVLFEDDDLLVVNKPPGLVVHPAAGHAQDTLVNALVAHTSTLAMKFGEDRPGIVHRLDKDTSGLLVVAKNDFAQENLSHQFRNRSIHRLYQAMVIGFPYKKEGQISSFLARHPTERQRYSSILDADRKIISSISQNPGHGKWAVTNFKVLKTNPAGLSFLQLKLETGRTHQIRVHLSELRCPILGDHTYGASRRITSIHGSHNQAVAKNVSRTALHAAELGFIHPRTLQSLEFQVPWPDLQEARLHFFGEGY